MIDVTRLESRIHCNVEADRGITISHHYAEARELGLFHTDPQPRDVQRLNDIEAHIRERIEPKRYRIGTREHVTTTELLNYQVTIHGHRAWIDAVVAHMMPDGKRHHDHLTIDLHDEHELTPLIHAIHDDHHELCGLKRIHGTARPRRTRLTP